MADAFNPKPDCFLPPMPAIEGPLVPSEDVCTPSQPFFEFPIYELQPPVPPSFDFGCTPPRVKNDFTQKNTPKFEARVVTETERGPCDPEIVFEVDIPQCVDIPIKEQKIELVKGPPSVKAEFKKDPDVCQQEFNLDIKIPEDPCVDLVVTPSISTGFPSISATSEVTEKDPASCVVDLNLDIVVPPCVTLQTSATMVQGNDNVGSIQLQANPVPSDPCTRTLSLDIVLPKIVSSDEVCEAMAASTRSIASLSGLQTVDRVFVPADALVLVKNQTNKAQNGVYKAGAGAWTRTCDLKAGIIVSVRGGGKNKNSAWILTTEDPIVIDTTGLDFAEVGGTCCCYAKAATTDNITLAGAGQTIDGILCNVDDIVLVKNQTNAAQNGPYVVKDDTWDRTCNITPGMTVHVRKGDTQALTAWILNTEETITVDTTPLTYEQLRAPGNATVDAASTGVLTLSGAQTVDGVLLGDGMKVLVKDQNATGAAHVQNGIYTVRTGAWTRDNSGFVHGMTVTVRKGTTNARSTYMLITDPPITVGTTPLLFQKEKDPFVVVRTTNTESGGSFEVTPTPGDLVLNRTVSPASSGVFRVNADLSLTVVYDSSDANIGLVVVVREGNLLGKTMWIHLGSGIWEGFVGFLR